LRHVKSNHGAGAGGVAGAGRRVSSHGKFGADTAPAEGGSGRPNGGRCGRAEGADISTGVRVWSEGGGVPPSES
jgi:hypothetical protein